MRLRATFQSATGGAARVPASGGANPDPFWANVVLLVNGDTLTDATGRHGLVASDGAPAGSADGILLDGNSAIEVTGALADFAFPGDFTLEWQIRGDRSKDATAVFFANLSDDPGTFEAYARGAATWQMGLWGPGNVQQEFPPPVITGDFVDLALVRAGATTALYVDGAHVWESNTAFNFVPAAPTALYLGREGSYGGKFFKGNLRTRVTKGVARYSGAAYVPSTWPIPT